MVLQSVPDLPYGPNNTARMILDKRAWRTFLEQLLRDPAQLAGYSILKYSANGEVIAADCSCGSGGVTGVICKLSRVRGIRRYVSAMVSSPRSRRNFWLAGELLGDGIDTALPIALIEKRGVAGDAWLVTARLDGLVDLDQVALTLLARLDRNKLRRVKDRLIERIADVVMQLQRAGWRHRDLKASNVMLTDWDSDDARVWLVDLDGLRRARRRGDLDLRPVIRLAASLLGHRSVSTSDGARFLKKLLVRLGDGKGGAWRNLLKTMMREAERYNKRAAGRKTSKLDGFG